MIGGRKVSREQVKIRDSEYTEEESNVETNMFGRIINNDKPTPPCFIFSCIEKKVHMSFHQLLVQLDYN